jgi:flagellar FliL protein
MSAAATADAGAAPAKGKKKLIIIIAAVLLLVLGGGGAAVVMMKKKAHAAAAADEEGGDEAAEEEAPRPAKSKKKIDPAHPPTFVPLDPFVVNLADKDAERYAQVGVTLEVEDPKSAEQLKLYMPAIRNGILMLLAHKTATELLEREGKERLAREILREASAPLGYEIEVDAAPSGKKRKKQADEGPIKAVHFSNFIIQ